ncbi:aminotransferase class I/II-fold pyridoxal phosphate-dependent enzyme [Candidatus Dependentiae bacterium]|nr:aminotransferase class I/II-fold pyridoxal phosphate-dependent enzyme [Candidatus Dependentiae bacterium]
MEYEKTSMLNFLKVKGKDIFETAKEFYNFTLEVKEHEHYFYRRISYNGSAPRMLVLDIYTNEKKEMLNFAGNDYLNLTRHPRTIKAGREALEKYGTGAGSVPLLGGTFDIHVELEKKIAKFKGCEDSIIYTSGFGSNLGSLLALLKKNDLALLDQFVHASIVDGCKSTNIKYFLHSDMNSLETILKKSKGNYETILVGVDGVYSMDGDIAPLPEILELTKKYGAYLFVDDAHATGVIGKNGKGTAEYHNLEGKIDIVAGTFSKGLGVVGGFFGSNKELIEYLHFFSRAYMFSTAMTPQAAGSLLEGLDVIIDEPERRNKLWENIRYLGEKLRNLGFNLGFSETAIFPIIIGDHLIVKEIVSYLHKNNIYVNLVLFPAVPRALSRIRISIMQGHSIDDLDQLIFHLETIGRKLGVI